MNRIAVTTCVALGTMGVLAAATSGARAGGKASSIFNERDLVVTLVTPTLNQEILPDASDPGLNNVITVQFSSILNPRDVIDTQNVVNQLSPKVELLTSNFERVPGTPTVRKNRFQFDPFSKTTPVLAQGQYTLNLKSSMRNTRGSLLNGGVADYTTAFSVGTDVYPPVIRRVTPVNGQTSIGLLEPIIVTFNEPIDPSSMIGTIFLEDGSTNPPTTIPMLGGQPQLARKGFDIVVTPDPCFGYPPKTNVQLRIQGQGSSTSPPAPVIASPLTDVFQNKLRRDVSLRWTVDPTITTLFHSPNGDFDELTGFFKLTFQTKGIKPFPVGLRPGGSQMNYPPPYAAPCNPLLWLAPSCKVTGNCTNYTTSNGFGEMDLRAYITRFNQGQTDFSLISILPNTPVRLGRPAGVVFDPRIIAPTGTAADYHTYIYVVDERSQTVLVLRSDNFKVIGRLGGFQTPRDVGLSDNTAGSAATLYVSNFGSNELVAVDLDTIAVTFNSQPGSPSPCAAIKDNQSHRKSMPAGAGPTEVAADCYLSQRVMCCNSLENSISVFDVRTNKKVKTNYEAGSNPVSCDWNTWQFGGIRVAVIANQGGLFDPNGSASFFISSPPLGGGFLGAAQVRDGIESTVTDGIKNPAHVWGNSKWIDPPPPFGTLTSLPIRWWLSNTGGTSIMDLRFSASGLFGLSLSPTAVNTLTVGLNPSSTCMDPFYPNAIVLSSVLGTGSMTAANPTRAVDPFPISVPGVRRLFNTYTN